MGTTLITLDASGLVSLVVVRDPLHEVAERALAGEKRPFLVPAASLGEVGYLIESRSASALDSFLEDLRDGRWTVDCGDADWVRVLELVRRYADLPLGLVDAAVIACAERHGGRVLTLDLRHFGVVAREGTITIVP